jgi:hypothetical protein
VVVAAARLEDTAADARIDGLTGAAGFADIAGAGINEAPWLDVNGEMGSASGATTATPTDAVAKTIVTTVSFDGTASPPNHAAASRPRMKSPPTPLIRVCTPDREPQLLATIPMVARHACTRDNPPLSLRKIGVRHQRGYAL